MLLKSFVDTKIEIESRRHCIDIDDNDDCDKHKLEMIEGYVFKIMNKNF